MRKLSTDADALPVLVAQLMGRMSFRKAAKQWGLSTMMLYRIVKPDTLSGEPKPPAPEVLRAIAGDNEDLYARLALAAYGLLVSPDEIAERHRVPV